MLHVEEIRPLRLPESPHNRLVTIGIVAGIHVVVISAFILSLHPEVLAFKSEKPIQTYWIPDKHQDISPPSHPPLVDLQHPVQDSAVQPVIKIEESQGSITVPLAPPTGPIGPTVRDFGPRAMAGTHTIPDYPPIDTRLGHEGTVMLKLAIDERGIVTDAVVERSSGYGSLDQAAVNWVKAHWRYYPATHAGDPVTSSADVTVTFRLTGRN